MWRANHASGLSCAVSYGDVIKFMARANAGHALKFERPMYQLGDWTFVRPGVV